MFAHLPDTIKQKVIRYLESNNFPAAKQLHDAWLQQQIQNTVEIEETSQALQAAKSGKH